MASSASAPPRRRAARVLRIVGISMVATLALVALVLALFAERWVDGYARDSAAALGRELGRPIEIGEIDVSALTGRAEVRGLVIGPAAGEPATAPALRLGRAWVDVGMLRTLLSLGFRPYVEEVHAENLTINVVERRDGTLNWEQIAGGDSEPPQTEEPSRRVRNARLGELRVEGAEVAFVAADGGEAARIADIALEVRNAGYEAGLTLDLAAAALAKERNLSLHAEVGSLAEEGIPPLEALRLKLEPTQLAALAGFVEKLLEPGALPARGVLRADVALSEHGAAKGTIGLARAALPAGEPFDAQLEFEAARTRERIVLRHARLAVGPMQLDAEATIEGLPDAPELRKVALRSKALSFESLRAVYPALDALTAPAVLHGPFALRASGGGDAARQAAEVEVTLTDARITVPDQLEKPAGTPLFVRAQLETGEGAVAFAPLRVQLAEFALVASGKIANLDRDAPSLSLRVETPDPRVSSLLKLLPPVARETGGEPLGGTLSLQGTLEGTTERYELDASLTLSSLDVRVPEATLVGGGSARVKLRGEPAGIGGKVAVDFTELAAVYRDVMNKPAGTPLRIDAALTREGAAQALALSAELDALVLRATGTVRGAAPARSLRASVEVPRCEVRGLARLLPGVDASGLGDIHFGGKLEVEGTEGEPASLRLRVPSFTARAGRSDLRGSLRATNAERPEVELTAQAGYLDVTDFLPGSDSGRAEHPPREERDQEAAGPSLLARVRGLASLEAARGSAGGVSFEDLRATLRLADGRAIAERLEVGVFGGRFEGTGSVFPLAPGAGDYQLKGGLENIQVASALAQLAGVRDLLTGTLGGRVDVTARALTPDALKQSLTGMLEGRVAEGVFLPAHGYAALSEQLGRIAELPVVASALADARAALSIAPDQRWALRDLAGALRFERGAAVLARPLTVETPQGDLRVEGKVGLSSASDLRGSFALEPSALTALTQGKVDFNEPVSLPFRIEGPLTQPAFRFDELGRVVAPLVRTLVEQEGKRRLGEAADAVLERTGLEDEAEEARRAIKERLGRRRDGEARRR